jgi:hypothetical protein
VSDPSKDKRRALLCMSLPPLTTQQTSNIPHSEG